jgi:hypothetical protein
MRAAVYLPLAALALAACHNGDSLAPGNRSATSESSTASRDLAQEIHVDYRTDAAIAAAPTATTESKAFRLVRGGIHWFEGGTVEYRILGTEPVGGANTAIVTSEGTVDGFITTRSLSRNDGTSQINPCTGEPNAVEWASIDGEGGIVGATATCFNLITKEILGFAMTLDADEPWSVSGSLSAIDVQDAVTHEFGHVAGLTHVGAPKDACLTMFPTLDLGEIQKRTLGLGDKLGLQRLYDSQDVTPGSCGS